MTVATIQGEYVTETDWFLTALAVVGVGGSSDVSLYGDGPNALVKGATPPDIPRRSARVIVDGVSVTTAIAAGGPVFVRALPTADNSFFANLESYSSGVGTYDVHLIAPLEIPLSLGKYAWLIVFATFAQNDQVCLSAWGHWQTTEQKPDEQEVILKGYKRPLERRY